MRVLYVKNIWGTAKDSAEPQIVGHYSCDDEAQYRNDLSQLKYYKAPEDLSDVNFDLDANEGTVYKPWYENKKIDFLLDWLSENFDRLKIQNVERPRRWLKPEVICMRGLLTTLLLTPYEKTDGWIICASKFRGTIYLCHFDTDVVERKKSKPLDSHHRINTARGHKFEQYLVSDEPSTNPDLSVPLNENEEFCGVFESEINNISLLYAAQIDGICSQEPIQNTLEGKNVELIELKSIPHSMVSSTGKIKSRRAFITLKWWCQSYLVGIRRIICGYKTDGLVKEMKEYKLDEIKHSLGMYSTKRCLGFCNKFLEIVTDIVRKNHRRCLYKFTFYPVDQTIRVQEVPPNPDSKYHFLHSSYIDRARQHSPDL